MFGTGYFGMEYFGQGYAVVVPVPPPVPPQPVPSGGGQFVGGGSVRHERNDWRHIHEQNLEWERLRMDDNEILALIKTFLQCLS